MQRPPVIYPLFASLASLPGVGPRTLKLYEKLCGGRVIDLLLHAPTGLTVRHPVDTLADAATGSLIVLPITVEGHRPPASPGKPWRVMVRDAENQPLTLVFFHANTRYLEDLLPPGAQRVVSGKLEQHGLFLNMLHPDVVAVSERHTLPLTEPVYPLTAGLSNKQVGKATRAALQRLPKLPEWLDQALLSKNNWPDWFTAFHKLHHPENVADLLPTAPHRQRLAFDEMLAHQLALALLRAEQTRLPGIGQPGTGALQSRLKASLPFQLTAGQEQAFTEIATDMAAPHRMLRLLQGDVGSGKTVVAFMAALQAIESGQQAAIMAPTEILARQHALTMAAWAKATGIEVITLTGRDKGKARERLLESIATGRAHLVIGTHALFQEDVNFHNLGLVVIDEQHRFGVHQRLSLSAKGLTPDLLVMTATPIPRTLLLTAFGDMEVSQLLDKPAGRKPIQTSVLPLERMPDLLARLQHAIRHDGGKAYWVCPLVEESEMVDLAAATLRHDSLNQALGGRVGLVHGRMKAEEKDAVIQAFLADELDVLVATTVIEVGVNVPSATIMVIEHAERFGLAQLHQLRGRVGRGDKQGSCILLYDSTLSKTGAARLKTLRETEDGFVIAEADMKLRGAGDILGTRQSGLPDLKLADWEAHSGLLLAATQHARLLLARDARLQSPQGAAAQTLLSTFGKDEAVQYLQAG